MTERERVVFPEVGPVRVQSPFTFLPPSPPPPPPHLPPPLPYSRTLPPPRDPCRFLVKRTGDTKSSFDTGVSHLEPLSKSLHLSGPPFPHTHKMVRMCVYDSLYMCPCMLHDPEGLRIPGIISLLLKWAEVSTPDEDFKSKHV